MRGARPSNGYGLVGQTWSWTRFNLHLTELFNLLINPEQHGFALRWHRDTIRGEATEDEEREALNHWHAGVRFNACDICKANGALTGAVEYVRKEDRAWNLPLLTLAG